MNLKTLKTVGKANEYLCAIERNQNGKYNVRVRATFALERSFSHSRSAANSQRGWMLPVYFLASSFNAAMKKLEECLQILQKSEDRLRFWTVERNDDPKLAGDLLEEFGLWLDRRREFPRKAAALAVSSERSVPASTLAPVRRLLAECISQERPGDRATLASD